MRLIGHWDGEEEARWIGEEIEALGRGTRGLDPVRPDGIAILVRASFQMRAFEDRFLTIGLPYRVIGGPRFYERQEIRDAMAYFRVAVSPDDGLAFERIVNVPKRGIGDKALQEINRTARDNGVSLLDAAGLLVANGGLPARARAALGQLVDGFDRWHAAVREGRDHLELAEAILEEVGLHRDVARRALARRRRPPRQPQGARQGARRVREPAGLPRARQPGHGQRDRRGRREGLAS